MSATVERLLELVEQIDDLDRQRAAATEKRDRAIRLLARDKSAADIAKLTGMSRQMVHRIVAARPADA